MRLLYVTANPHEEDRSFGLRTGRAVMAHIKQKHPEVDVHTIDLYNAEVPEIDRDVLSAWGALQAGTAFTDLPAVAQTKIAQMNALLEQFLAADRVVLVNPMWNFGAPPRFKAFIDALVIENRTFKYTEHGPVGLVEGKKVLHIIASGGMYSAPPQSAYAFTKTHTESVFHFLGVHDVHTVWVEGTAMTPPEGAQALIDKATEQAIALLPEFLSA
jgi:FMN-dependent NADH-azoreductase